jgi:hypothetical protein
MQLQFPAGPGIVQNAMSFLPGARDGPGKLRRFAGHGDGNERGMSAAGEEKAIRPKHDLIVKFY